MSEPAKLQRPGEVSRVGAKGNISIYYFPEQLTVASVTIILHLRSQN